MSFVSIGSLRHRLVLEEAQRTDDGGGGVTKSWQEVATVWAAIREKSGREGVAAGRLSGSVSHEITIRYLDGVMPAMRFRMDTRIFEIIGVLNAFEARRWIKCLCVERDL